MKEPAATVVSLSPIRKVIAARMREAKQSIPHFRVAVDIELDALIALRTAMNSSGETEKLSINDFLIKAAALALIEIPAVNIQWQDNSLHQSAHADISVIVALKDGLSTPILRACEGKTVRQISAEVRELAARAARNALKMDEIVGGSFSISNLGMHGVDAFDAIINPPQCAILAVGTAKRQWLVGTNDSPRAASVLRATLSADHRALDGATCAAFMSALRKAVEHPERLIEQEKT